MLKKIILVLGLIFGRSVVAGTPAIPSGLTATSISDTGVFLKWNNTANDTSYGIYQDGALIDVAPKNQYQVAGMAAGVQYVFGVQGRNDPTDTASGISPSITVTTTTDAPPPSVQKVAPFGTFGVSLNNAVPGTGATNLGKAEDAAVASGDTGVAIFGARADTPTAATTSANGDYSNLATDSAGVQYTRPRPMASYSAVYRLADATAGQLSATFTFVANTNKQLGTIYHTAGSTKEVWIRKISLIVSTGALGVYNFEIRPLSAATAPATGNPAITPGLHDQLDAAAEATCLTLPTTAGSLVAANQPIGTPFEWNSAAVAAAGNPNGLRDAELVLWDATSPGDGRKPLHMAAGVASGYAINGRCTTAVALRYMLLIEFTEN